MNVKVTLVVLSWGVVFTLFLSHQPIDGAGMLLLSIASWLCGFLSLRWVTEHEPKRAFIAGFIARSSTDDVDEAFRRWTARMADRF